jgi:glucose/arabinose dehydrogenase
MGHVAKRLAFLAAAAAVLLLPVSSAGAGTVPAGFQEKAVMSGFTEPTSVVFSPDGRVFVAEKSGVIKVFDGVTDTTPQVFADLSREVYNYWDRGLLGMALDPAFPARPYIYVLYTLDAKPGGAVPAWGGTSLGDTCPNPPGATVNGCVATGRLSKLTASGNSMSAETPLITDWCQQFPSHSIGSVGFGADGSLYVSGGEGASFNYADWGQTGNPCGDPPGGVGGSMAPPTAEGGSLRSQDVRTPADPTGLDGTLLRVDPDTGQGVAANPFAGSSDANARRILAYGLRNPFRFTIRPGTNEAWLGDVGNSTWEEIDRVDPASATGQNFGWPCYEGDNASSARLFEWDAANLNLCETLYSQGAAAVSAPYYAYKHSEKVVPGETCGSGSSSISGLAFYESGPFPNAYNGALFFADYSRGCIWAMLPGANGKPNPANIQTFDAGASGPVNLTVGSEGSLYFPDLNNGKVWRISHVVGDQPPVAAVTATPKNGPAPLSVQLSASGSTDADPGDTLSYSWDLDGDGHFGDSTAVSPTHVYGEAGTYAASVRVSDPDGASDTASVSIQVDNTPPTAAITSPSESLTWAVGDPISFAGTATDAEDGALPASAYQWRVIVHHCPSNCHLHQIEAISGVKSGVFVAPDHEYPSWLEIQLTVTDSSGLTDTRSVAVLPKTVSISLQTLPASGFALAVDGQSTVSPSSTTVIKGSNNTISAPAQSLNGTAYAFGAWSDGGAATHNVTADQNLDLTAVFGPPAAPTIAGVSPSSPASDNNPVVKGTVGTDFPAAVKIFKSANCSGAAAATATPAQFTGSGVAVPVSSDATVSLSAATTNAAGSSSCSNAVSYTEDSTAPVAPTVTATSPPSPANANAPLVKGSAESGSVVQLFKSSSCSGSAVATGSASELATGLTATVADDSSTSFTARATDAAGNASVCSSALVYVEDSTPPAAPTIVSTSPRSPANDNNPEVKGTVGSGSPVGIKLYASSNCSGSPVTGSVATFTGPGIAVAVPGDQTSNFSARASDAAGNDSACSNSLPYSEDSTLPEAPTILATVPSSPANDNSPEVSGSAAVDSTVRIYRSSDCSGPVAASGSGSAFASGLTVTVADDSTTQLSASAIDAAANVSGCSQPLAYVEDSTPPAAPAITATSPPSPADDNVPEVIGGVGAGSPVSVKLYATANCSGTAVSGSVAAFTAGGIAMTVPSDQTSSFSARATDAAGNDSACSNAFSYREDSTLPATPTLEATSPPSPANDNSPLVVGSSDSGTTARIYESGNCTGPVAAAASAADLAAGLPVAVLDDSTTPLTAIAADSAGNESGCSPALLYSEDSTPPPAPTLSATSPASPANDNDPRVSGDAAAGSQVRIYESGNCTGPVAAVGNPAELAAGLAVAIADDASVPLAATATDAAGNTSACSAAISYVEDSRPPAAPAIGSIPLAPANDNRPTIAGVAEDGASVALYASADCAGPVTASGTAAALAAGFGVAVPDDSVTPFAATATDAAGNRSACSLALAYREDSTPPQTSIKRGPPLRLVAPRGGPRRLANLRASFSYGSDDPSAHFLCKLDGSPYRPCEAPATRVRLKPGTHRFSVYAVDAAGNADPTPASRSVRLVAMGRRRG